MILKVKLLLIIKMNQYDNDYKRLQVLGYKNQYNKEHLVIG